MLHMYVYSTHVKRLACEGDIFWFYTSPILACYMPHDDVISFKVLIYTYIYIYISLCFERHDLIICIAFSGQKDSP